MTSTSVWNHLAERGQAIGADALIDRLEADLTQIEPQRVPRSRPRLVTRLMALTTAVLVIGLLGLALGSRIRGSDQRVTATHTEGWFARPSFLPPGFTLVDEPRQANADQTHDLRYRRGAPLTREVAVIDVHSYRGAIDIGLNNWPSRAAHEVEVRGHRALFIVTLPEQPDRGLRIVSWQEHANLGVTIVAQGPLDEATVLAVAESIRVGE